MLEGFREGKRETKRKRKNRSSADHENPCIWEGGERRMDEQMGKSVTGSSLYVETFDQRDSGMFVYPRFMSPDCISCMRHAV